MFQRLMSHVSFFLVHFEVFVPSDAEADKRQALRKKKKKKLDNL